MGQQAVQRLPGWAPGQTAPAGLRELWQRWGLRWQPPAAEQLAGQLASWLDWRDAVALAQALTLPPRAPQASAAPDAVPLLARVLKELQAGFTDRSLVQRGPTPQAGAATAGLADAAAPFRLHHANQQRHMAARLSALRQQLRQQVAARLPQLAALDAVFEAALNAREQQQLAALPSMLVRRAALWRAQRPEADEAATPWPADGWRTALWAELQDALQAELTFRLQALQGLLEALQPENHSCA